MIYQFLQSIFYYLYHRTNAPPTPKANKPVKGEEKGWFATLLTKILSNISVTIDNLIIKCNHRDISASLSLTQLKVYSADPKNGWLFMFNNLNDSLELLSKAIEVKELGLSVNGRSTHPPILHRFNAKLHLQIPFGRKIPDDTETLTVQSSQNV